MYYTKTKPAGQFRAGWCFATKRSMESEPDVVLDLFELMHGEGELHHVGEAVRVGRLHFLDGADAE